MTLVLDPQHVEAIRRHCEADYPAEACGLIGGLWETDAAKTAVMLVALVNTRRDSPRSRYLIAPEAFRITQARLDRDGLEVIGVYHSHPDHQAKPSAYDREHAWPRLSYVILQVARGKAAAQRSWVLSDDRSAFAEECLIVEGRSYASHSLDSHAAPAIRRRP